MFFGSRTVISLDNLKAFLKYSKETSVCINDVFDQLTMLEYKQNISYTV
jgi:hypothetical protein